MFTLSANSTIRRNRILRHIANNIRRSSSYICIGYKYKIMLDWFWSIVLIGTGFGMLYLALRLLRKSQFMKALVIGVLGIIYLYYSCAYAKKRDFTHKL